MARGGFSQEELDALNNNKYVIYAENNRIVYSNEFKFLFMKEFESGKAPKDIFHAAGFDTDALGSKRIERAIINLLRAKVELLLTVGFIDREKYDYSIRDKGIFYQLIHDTVLKYDITKGLTDLCNILGLEQRGYYKYLKKKKLTAINCASGSQDT